MKLCYSFQYLQWVGQPGGSGLCWYLACLSGDAAGIDRVEAAAGLGGSAFVASTGLVSTGLVSTGVGVVIVLIAVVSRRGGPASLCGRGSGLPGGESGFGPDVPFRFERLRSWAIMLSINARWRALLASALLSMLACSS